MIDESEIFKIAVGLPAAERSAYLDAACAGQPEVRAGVEELLHSHEVSGFMEAQAAASLNPTIEAELARLKPEEVGEHIGQYKLLEQIGEGGFGTVWVADQEQPVRRRVALKIIRMGMNSKEVVARFEQERQALAMMDHPHIAKVFDAGSTPWGRPYFVMELVRGVKITEYCDQANLPTEERLTLFIDVCHAVQHAHQKGIIHRDLKPSNILVTLQDGVPVPKVIDFGVAKATQQQRLTDLTIFTQVQQMIGTPLYMSPEQAEMSGLDIDTRSDIYSLGVLLYELLTGRTPFDPQDLMKAGIDEIRRVIREQDPPTPSMFLKSMANAALVTVAQRRQCDPERLAKIVRGDLDWIVMRALEKDRTRRYETANGLAADLQRHLHSEPVLARPPSVGYRFRRLVVRNKATFAAAGAVVLALIIGLGIATHSFLRERDALRQMHQERDNAQASARSEKRAKNESRERLAQIEKANHILTSVFAKLDPRSEKLGSKPLGTELGDRLGEAAELLEGEAIGDAVVVARMQIELGQSLSDLGFPKKAIVVLEKANRTMKDNLGQDHPDTLLGMTKLASAYWMSGDINKALLLSEKTLQLKIVRLGPEHPDTLESMSDLATVYHDARRYDEAVPLLEKTLKLQKVVLGPDHLNTLTCMNNLASAYQDAGRMDQALPLYEETLALSKAKLGPNHPDTLGSMNNLAEAYQSSGRINQALPLYEETVKLFVTKLGPDHPDTLTIMHNLASAYGDAGKAPQALELFGQTVQLRKKTLGPDDPDTLSSMHELALLRWKGGKLGEALPVFEEVFEVRKAKLGPDDQDTIISMNLLALAYQDAGRQRQALPLFKEAIKLGGAKVKAEPSASRAFVRTLTKCYGIFLSKRGVIHLPADGQLLADIALLLSESSDNELAVAVAGRALKLQPGNEGATSVLVAAKLRNPASPK